LGQELAAKIEFPLEEPKSFSLFTHCFTYKKNLTAIRNISRALNTCGIAVLGFDFTGLGENKGDFENTNFSSNVEDLISATDYLKMNHKAPEIIIAHSLIGAAVIFSVHVIPSIEAVAMIASPSNPKHISNLLKSGIDEIKTTGEVKLKIDGHEFKIQKQFLDAINEKNMEQVLTF
jgi:putative redox protein